jgi:hypothetical protein
MLVTFNQLGRLGRLGNQLFQIAAAIGEARRRGWDYAFLPWPYAEYFEHSLPELPAEANTLPIYREPTFSFQQPDFVESRQLLGYFQSERYFAHCAAEIRSAFQPKAWITEQCRSQCRELFEGSTCSIHVRRGDYVNNPFFVDLATTDYYARAMEQLPANTRLVFFSDDIEFCRKRFRDKRFVFVQTNHEVIDLHLMSLCDFHIISNSSFAWWGAWLDPRPDKLVIAPHHWYRGVAADPQYKFVAGPPHRGYHDTRDLVPAAWVRV